MSYLIIADGNVLTITEGNYPALSVGLDAEKPTSPSIGNMHIATDTGKNYVCFVSGTWNIVSSPTVDSYFNHLGTTDNMMSITTSGNATGLTNSANHRMDLSTGTLATGKSIYKGAVTIYPDNEDVCFNLKVQNVVNGANGAKFTYFGLIEDPATIVSGAFFYCDNNNDWYVMTQNGPLTVETTAITAIASGDRIAIYGKKQKMLYFVNGELIASHSISNTGVTWIPCAVVSATDANVSTARQISIDYISWEILK